MRKRFIYKLVLFAAFGAMMLTGCKDRATASQATYRVAGIACMEQGDYEGAVDAFEAALRQKIGGVGADELDICYYKGSAQFAAGDIQAAMATYNAIIDFDKKQADAYYLRGCLYLMQGNTEAAKTDFDNAVKYHPNEYELYIGIYENLSGAGFVDEGELYLNQAFTIKGEAASNLEYRGRIHYLLGDYESALADLSAASEAGSTSAQLYLAKTYDAMGDDETAEAYYTEYLTLNEDSREALGAMGAIMLEKQQYAKAVTYLEKALAIESKAGEQGLMRDLVIAYEYTGAFEKAWELMQQYVALYPDDEQAQTEYIFLKNRQMKEEINSPVGVNE